jgi:hypothetical protein
MEAIYTSSHHDSSGTASETSDKITGKTRNEMRQARTHTWAPDISPKLKSWQDLSIKVNPKVTEEVMHHAGLRVDRGLHLRLHVYKVIHSSLMSSNPFHHVLSLVNPITDVAFQKRVPGRGGGSGSKARLGVTMRGVVTTTLMVTRCHTRFLRPKPDAHRMYGQDQVVIHTVRM